MLAHLMHPEFMRYVSDRRFNAIARIQIASITQDSNSGENTITYASDPALTAVACQVDPVSSDAELRRPDLTLVDNGYSILLAQYAPTITIQSNVILDDGTIHNVLKIAHDDSHSHTVLTTEIIS
jgi:hypothetical protein